MIMKLINTKGYFSVLRKMEEAFSLMKIPKEKEKLNISKMLMVDMNQEICLFV